MLFQLMDSKKDCAGVYIDGNFIWDKIPEGITKTWSYSDHLFGRDIDYAQLLVGGCSLDDVCPEHLRERWSRSQGLLKAHFRGFNTAKIRLDGICFYEIVPEKHLRHYFDTKNEITQWVFDNYERPEHYSLLKRAQAAIKELKKHPVSINKMGIHRASANDPKAKHLYEQFKDTTPYVDYNLFGTVTGRLTTRKESFPILNLKTELKQFVLPTNDVFLELDFNAAEIRTMLALQEHEQPEEDIHEWNIKNVFKKDLSRDKAKQKIFAWLYNQESNAIKSNYYDREVLLERFYESTNEVVRTPFGRAINTPHRKALNYLLQSSSSDNTLERFIRISNFLRATKSHVAFVVHDSVVIDLHRDDRRIIPQLKQMFGETRLGKFKVNCSLGKNLGDMRDFSW
tara:strand:- start:1824 stop:3017 length:1194 start_codon:yes stop_codon:yes gene_type:complete